MSNRINVDEVRQRAASIRENWSLAERHRRTGLPPDLPEKLRTYLTGWPTSQSTARFRVLSF